MNQRSQTLVNDAAFLLTEVDREDEEEDQSVAVVFDKAKRKASPYVGRFIDNLQRCSPSSYIQFHKQTPAIAELYIKPAFDLIWETDQTNYWEDPDSAKTSDRDPMLTLLAAVQVVHYSSVLAAMEREDSRREVREWINAFDDEATTLPADSSLLHALLIDSPFQEPFVFRMINKLPNSLRALPQQRNALSTTQ